jgi:HK97 family phage major capsid protein
MEILLHGPENIDMSRTLYNGLPLLVNHDDTELPIGRLRNIRIDETTKKLRADAYFSNRFEAQAVKEDIINGITGDVSVGYKILDYKLEKSLEKDVPNNVFVTRWMPYEGSIVALPADSSVGVGRSDDEELEIEIPEDEVLEDEKAMKPEDKPMECKGEPKEDETPSEDASELQAETQEEATEDPKEEATETPAEESVEEEEESVIEDTEDPKEGNKGKSDLLDIKGSDLKAIKQAALNLGLKTESEIDELLTKSLSLEDLRSEVLKQSSNIITSSKTTISQKGIKMIDNETLYRSLASAIKGNFSEVDQALLGTSINQTGARSFSADLFTRANEMTSTSKGNNAVYEQNIGFLELLRARAAVLKAGAKTRSGNGSLSYVRQKAAVAATLRAENSGTTSNTFADFEKVSYTPKALTAKVYITDELQKESALDIISVLKGDMVSQFGIAIDNYAINGNASPAINGLLSAATITAGLYNKDLGVAALPTWATVNALKAAVDAKAVNLDACSWLVTPSLLGVLESTQKMTNGQAIATDGKVNGFPILSSSNVPVATLNHTALFGDFSQLEICLQGPTEFMIDVQSRFDEGITILTARQYFDVGVLQPSAFAKCANFLVA